MSDSGAPEQDGAARVNGLMASLGKRTQERDAALARIAELEAIVGQASGDSSAQDGATRDSTPNLNDGDMFEVVNGQLEPFEAPQPKVHNEAVRRDYQPKDDGSAKSAWAQLASTLGTSADDGSW